MLAQVRLVGSPQFRNLQLQSLHAFADGRQIQDAIISCRARSSLEQFTDGNFEDIGQLHKRRDSKVLLASLDRSGKRTCQAAPVGKFFLRPFTLLAKRSDPITKVLPNRKCILHHS